MNRADNEALQHMLSQLRELGKPTLSTAATKLTHVATAIGIQPGLNDQGAAVLFAAQLLYLLAHEDEDDGEL